MHSGSKIKKGTIQNKTEVKGVQLEIALSLASNSLSLFVSESLNLVSKRFGCKKILVQKNLGSAKIISKKSLRPKKNLGPKTILS